MGILDSGRQGTGRLREKQLTVTQDMIDALKQKVNALGGTRPDVALEYISDNTYELYKTKPAIIKGENATHAPKTFTVGSGDNAVTYNGETITIKNWTNVVTYEVKDETGKFIPHLQRRKCPVVNRHIHDSGSLERWFPVKRRFRYGRTYRNSNELIVSQIHSR